MAYVVLVRQSPRTGNPEIWAYDDQPGGTVLVFGSLVTGGLNTQKKFSGYGASNVNKKLRDGYAQSSQSSAVLRSDIDDARKCFGAASPVPATVASAGILVDAYKAAGMSVPASVLAVFNAASSSPWPTPSAPAPAVAKPSSGTPKAKTKKIDLSIQSSDTAGCPWAW